MTEHFKPCCIVAYDKEILLVLVVLFVLELELHAENALLRILIPAICNVAVLVGNALVVFGEEEQPVGRGFSPHR